MVKASLSVAVMPAAVVLAVVVAAVNSSGVMDELSGQQRQHDHGEHDQLARSLFLIHAPYPLLFLSSNFCLGCSTYLYHLHAGNASLPS